MKYYVSPALAEMERTNLLKALQKMALRADSPYYKQLCTAKARLKIAQRYKDDAEAREQSKIVLELEECMRVWVTAMENLVEGKEYVFHIKDWETPLGGLCKTAPKRRRFIKAVNRHGVGFISVHNAERGRDHLIAIDTIARIEDV